MDAVYSIAHAHDVFWTVGTRGLNRIEQGVSQPVLQPMSRLFCCAALPQRILVGGDPYGIAYSDDDGAHWTGAWLQGTPYPVVCLAPDPANPQIVLAGSEGLGVLRSDDAGEHWQTCNVGLRGSSVAALAWAPSSPVARFPIWSMAFAATEEGVSRSPNGGLAWKACAGLSMPVQTLAVSSNFPVDQVVLAGTEASGLWRSDDGGRHFAPVEATPPSINVLAALPVGWLAGDTSSLWYSADGLSWSALPGSDPAFALLAAGDAVWVGEGSSVRSVFQTTP